MTLTWGPVNLAVGLGSALGNHVLSKALETWLSVLCGVTMLMSASPIAEPELIRLGQPTPAIKHSGMEFTHHCRSQGWIITKHSLVFGTWRCINSLGSWRERKPERLPYVMAASDKPHRD